MDSNWIIQQLEQFGDRTAFAIDGHHCTYLQLVDKIKTARQNLLSAHAIEPGESVAVVGDYTPNTAALLIALIANRNIVVPLTDENSAQHAKFFEMASVSCRLGYGENGFQGVRFNPPSRHELLAQLNEKQHPGIVLFTSGSTGNPKGVVLDANSLLERYQGLRLADARALRTAIFLKLDHIGGLNTLFATLFNGGVAIPQADRSAEAVCRNIEKFKVECLPTTPTFLNMLLFSGIYHNYDLGSLRLITYGTEPMPQSTLLSATKAFPNIRFKQTYGSTELGIFSTKSESSSSLMFKIGDSDSTQFKVVNDTLWIKTRGAMLGYLNAPSPFDAEGWFNTGDKVEQHGGYIRVLGRGGEIINVGGEKVYPSEIESLLLEVDNIKEVVVRGKSSPVTGAIVTALINLHRPESRTALQRRINDYCKGKIQDFKIPKLIQIIDEPLIGGRLKKRRNIA